MTTLPQPGSPASSYTAKFDAWNRLVSLDSGSTASYEYDGLNRRIKRTESSTTRHFFYSTNWQTLEERATESGSAAKQFVWGTVYVDELVLRDRDADSNSANGLEERLYATHDAQYNITALVNTTASVQERFAYTPYGVSTVLNADVTVKSGGTGYVWEHRYTGRRTDTVSGLQLNRNRYYHQQLGRWCSKDPIGYIDSENLYETTFTLFGMDPTGLAYVDADPTSAVNAPWCKVGLGYEYHYTPNGARSHDPWDFDPTNGLPKTILGNSDPDIYQTECKCTCCDSSECNQTMKVVCRAIYRGRIRISPSAIDLAPSRARATLRGTYGHEQRHVRNLLLGANLAAKSMSYFEAKVGCVSPALCAAKAMEIQNIGQQILNVRRSIELNHGQGANGAPAPADYEPQEDTQYRPLGGCYPEKPTCPPLKSVDPLEVSPCEK